MKASDTKQILAEDFAIKIVGLYKHLYEDAHETVMSKQLLRAATSIGANIAESAYAESNADFVHKLAISQKEASETSYWLRLLHKTDYIDDETFNFLEQELYTLRKVLGKVVKTFKDNL